MLGSLLGSRAVAMGTDEPFARGVGGTSGLHHWEKLLGLLSTPFTQIFRTCTESSSRFSETRSDATNYKNQSICYLVNELGQIL